MLEKVRLGKTGLMVTRIAMGCIPIQRLSEGDAVKLLRLAYDLGVNFYDTAHVYTDSEAKIGAAFPGTERRNVIIATKAMATTYEKTMEQLEESLRRLKTDYIDLYQWHNPDDLDGFQDGRGPYQAMLDAKKAGKVLHVGITNHHLGRANQVIDSGAFETLQFPISVLSSPEEIAMTERCAENDIGVIAMKAMCGGLLDDGRLPFVFLNQYRHIVPIWGIEKESELRQFIDLAANPEPFTEAMREEIERLRAEVGDEFCRGCGYCLPCPSGINLPMLMRISFLINRSGIGSQFTPQRIAEIENIDNCSNCRACVSRCPYHLNAPEQLKWQKSEFERLYQDYLAAKN